MTMDFSSVTAKQVDLNHVL